MAETSIKISQPDLARENLSRLLSACFYQPTADFSEQRVFASILQAASLISPVLRAGAEELGNAFEKEKLEDLLLDYSRLFLGPFEILAKPYGSVYLEGEKVVMGNTTMAVRSLYRQGGFELAEDFREVPDHIAAELEFLYLLIFRGNEALRLGDAGEAAEVRELAARFLVEHLGQWLRPFCEAVRQGARSDFYRRLAGLTEGFVGMELERIGAGSGADR